MLGNSARRVCNDGRLLTNCTQLTAVRALYSHGEAQRSAAKSTCWVDSANRRLSSRLLTLVASNYFSSRFQLTVYLIKTRKIVDNAIKLNIFQEIAPADLCSTHTRWPSPCFSEPDESRDLLRNPNRNGDRAQGNGERGRSCGREGHLLNSFPSLDLATNRIFTSRYILAFKTKIFGFRLSTWVQFMNNHEKPHRPEQLAASKQNLAAADFDL